MAQHTVANMVGDGFIMHSLRGGGWRRYVRSLDKETHRHNKWRPKHRQPNLWLPPMLFTVLAVFACIPAVLTG